MMRLHVIATVLVTIGLASPALAISRYNSTQMSCSTVRDHVIDEGAVILRYPSTRVAGMTLYDRYVTRNASCSPHEYAERAYVPTRDNPRCPVLNCQTYDPQPGRSGKPNIRF